MFVKVCPFPTASFILSHIIFAPNSFEPLKFVPATSPPVRSACSRFDSLRLAPINRAFTRIALLKLALSNSAPLKSVL